MLIKKLNVNVRFFILLHKNDLGINEEMLFLIKFVALNKLAQMMFGKNSLFKIKIFNSFLKKEKKILELIFNKKILINKTDLILSYFFK